MQMTLHFSSAVTRFGSMQQQRRLQQWASIHDGRTEKGGWGQDIPQIAGKHCRYSADRVKKFQIFLDIVYGSPPANQRTKKPVSLSLSLLLLTLLYCRILELLPAFSHGLLLWEVLREVYIGESKE